MRYSYPYPMTSTTVTVFLYYKEMDRFKIILGRRHENSDAFPNLLCAPGGFLDPARSDFAGETARQACVREIREETGLLIEPKKLALFEEYSDPKTDPRAHVVNLAFGYLLTKEQADQAKAGDDLSSLEIVESTDLPSIEHFAFNHYQLVLDAIGAFGLNGDRK